MIHTRPVALSKSAGGYEHMYNHDVLPTLGSSEKTSACLNGLQWRVIESINWIVAAEAGICKPEATWWAERRVFTVSNAKRHLAYKAKSLSTKKSEWIYTLASKCGEN